MDLSVLDGMQDILDRDPFMILYKFGGQGSTRGELVVKMAEISGVLREDLMKATYEQAVDAFVADNMSLYSRLQEPFAAQIASVFGEDSPFIPMMDASNIDFDDLRASPKYALSLTLPWRVFRATTAGILDRFPDIRDLVMYIASSNGTRFADRMAAVLQNAGAVTWENMFEIARSITGEPDLQVPLVVASTMRLMTLYPSEFTIEPFSFHSSATVADVVQQAWPFPHVLNDHIVTVGPPVSQFCVPHAIVDQHALIPLHTASINVVLVDNQSGSVIYNEGEINDFMTTAEGFWLTTSDSNVTQSTAPENISTARTVLTTIPYPNCFIPLWVSSDPDLPVDIPQQITVDGLPVVTSDMRYIMPHVSFCVTTNALTHSSGTTAVEYQQISSKYTLFARVVSSTPVERMIPPILQSASGYIERSPDVVSMVCEFVGNPIHKMLLWTMTNIGMI